MLVNVYPGDQWRDCHYILHSSMWLTPLRCSIFKWVGWLVYMIGYQFSCPSKGHQGGWTVGLLKPENSRRVALMLMAWLVMLFSCVFVWKYDESYRDRYRDSPPSYSHASLCESMMTYFPLLWFISPGGSLSYWITGTLPFTLQSSNTLPSIPLASGVKLSWLASSRWAIGLPNMWRVNLHIIVDQ